MEKEFPTIETKKLTLRNMTEEDAQDMFSYLSDQDVVKHMGMEPCQTVNGAMDEIKQYQSIYKDGTGIRWGITLKDSDRVLGLEKHSSLNKAKK